MGFSDADMMGRGGKTGSGRQMSESQENQQRRERLRKLALETVDLNKDPYFMRNHLGTYECKLCLTIHTNEGNYLAHTQGKRHQQNIARRLAKDAFEQQVRRGRMAWACCVHACVRTMRDPRASKTFSRRHPRGDRRSHARVVDVCLCRAHEHGIHAQCTGSVCLHTCRTPCICSLTPHAFLHVRPHTVSPPPPYPVAHTNPARRACTPARPRRIQRRSAKWPKSAGRGTA